MTTPFKILGKGGFGIVFEPALPNIDATGQRVDFPGYVAKVMFNKTEYDSAVAIIDRIQHAVPSLAFNLQRYRRGNGAIEFRDLPRNVQVELRNVVARHLQQRGIPSYQFPLYILRMPNLGLSIQDLMQSTERAALRTVPEQVLAAECLKLLRIVRDIQQAGFVHADIRETNVMCNPHTGTLTIIDFDWVRHMDTYYEEYPTYFYSHPPEEVVLLTKMKPYLEPVPSPDTPDAMGHWAYYQMSRIIVQQEHHRDWRLPRHRQNEVLHQLRLREQRLRTWIHDEMELRAWLDDTAQGFSEAIRRMQAGTTPEEREALFHSYIQASFDTADSFGLGVAFVAFASLLDPVRHRRLKRYLQDHLVPAMLRGNLYTRRSATGQWILGRLTPVQAVEAMELFVAQHFPGVLTPAPDVFADEIARLGVLGDFHTPTPKPTVPVLAAVTNAAVAATGGSTDVVPTPHATLNRRRSSTQSRRSSSRSRRSSTRSRAHRSP